MRLLDRYLLRELLHPLAYCFGGFLIFWVTFDLFNELTTLQGRQLSWLDIGEYYVAKTPEFLGTVLPVALLLALLYAITHHARHHELVAMRAAGVSLWRLSAPYLAVGLGCSAALFASNEYLAPRGTAAAEAILNRQVKDPQALTDLHWTRDVVFHNDRDGRAWNIGAYNLTTSQMLRVNVEWRGSDGARRQLFALRAGWNGNGWTFENCLLFSYAPPHSEFPLRTTTNSLAFPEFSETPRLIRSEIKIGSMTALRAAKKPRFSLAEILDYRRLHPELSGSKAAELDTQLHGRLAAPWTCLVVVLIALPFGAAPGRRNVAVGVAASIFIAFAFFILSRFSLALGTGDYLPGWLAGWAPNVIFGTVGFWLTWRLR